MEGNILKKTFSEIDLADPFFDTLKADYKEFEIWYSKKAKERATAYILKDVAGLQAFLYLKTEEGAVTDVMPPLPAAKRVKVGTFKVNPHGTRLGERFIKRIFDYSVVNEVNEMYVTVFSKHTALLKLFQRYGFTKIAEKTTINGTENVLLKNLREVKRDILLDYPLINPKNTRKFLLAIYPEYHTKLFPDSILDNESFDIIEDVSHTNSIHKVYICGVNISALRKGDVLIIYRTSDNKGPARFRSVVTSVCVVEEVRQKNSFPSLDEYISYCESYSVFKRSELTNWYNNNKYPYILRMTYNAAFRKRITRGILLDDINLSAEQYWGFFQLTDQQFEQITHLGKIHESLIIN